MTLTNDTPVQVDDNEPTTWGELCELNEFHPDEQAEIAAGLERSGSFLYGGGAQAEVLVTVVGWRP